MNINDLRTRIGTIAEELKGGLSVMVVTDEGEVRLDADAKVSAASLIKVPIMMAAYHKAKTRGLSLTQPVTAPMEKRVGGMGVLTHLSRDTTTPLKDIITLMIIVSDNTATNLAIDYVGLDYINEFMAERGCTNTVLGRRLMDYEARKLGRDNFISAEAMVNLLQHLWQDNSESGATMRGLLYAQQFNTKLPYLIPSDSQTKIAHKTGEIPGHEHDAGVIEVGDKRAFVAVLTHGLECSIAGQKAIQEIGLAVWQHLKS